MQRFGQLFSLPSLLEHLRGSQFLSRPQRTRLPCNAETRVHAEAGRRDFGRFHLCFFSDLALRRHLAWLVV